MEILGGCTGAVHNCLISLRNSVYLSIPLSELLFGSGGGAVLWIYLEDMFIGEVFLLDIEVWRG
ncbi:MAG: hypothetical protein QXF17_01980 [Ignisphaera sp.]